MLRRHAITLDELSHTTEHTPLVAATFCHYVGYIAAAGQLRLMPLRRHAIRCQLSWRFSPRFRRCFDAFAMPAMFSRHATHILPLRCLRFVFRARFFYADFISLLMLIISLFVCRFRTRHALRRH